MYEQAAWRAMSRAGQRGVPHRIAHYSESGSAVLRHYYLRCRDGYPRRNRALPVPTTDLASIPNRWAGPIA